ncbi:MAG: ABC transporter permease [Firmicutes bacterium]|nr:ABC transporter permease [Bacillota bacterium]
MASREQYLKDLRIRAHVITLGRIAVLVLFLALWEFSARVGWLDTFIFSSPVALWHTFIDMVRDGSIFLHTGITLYETLLSFMISTILGIIIAVLLWWCPRVRDISEPYWVALNSLPKSALAPILIVWFGNTTKSILITSISLTIVSTILTMLNGFLSVDPDKLTLIRSFGGTKRQILTKILLPGNIPVLMNVLKVNIGLCLIGVIIGEFLSAKAGLGYLIIYGSQIFKMNWVILSILILCLLAVAFYQLILWIATIYEKRRG